MTKKPTPKPAKPKVPRNKVQFGPTPVAAGSRLKPDKGGKSATKRNGK